MKKTITILAGMVVLLFVFNGNAQTSFWDTTGLAPMPTPRVGCTASVLDGKIYVIGGKFTRYGLPTSKVEVYDPVENIWDTTVLDLPGPLYLPVSEVVDDKIYVLGGSISGEPVDLVYEYDPNLGNWTIKQNIPVAIRQHSSAVINDAIYLVGGFPFIDSTFMYVPATGNWFVKNKTPSPRAALASEVVDDTIYAIGGLYDLVAHSEVFAYSAQDDIWVEKSSMIGKKMSAGSAVIDSDIYIFGGWTDYPWPDLPGEFSPETWVYNTTTDTWEDLEAEIPDEIIGFSSAVGVDADSNLCIYAIGGALQDYWDQGSGPHVSDRVIRLKVDSATVDIADPETNSKSSTEYMITVQPNPFNSTTSIRYHLETGTKVNIKIFNLAGQEVATLLDAYQIPGEHKIRWNAAGLSTGAYVFRFKTKTILQTRKCVLQ